MHALVVATRFLLLLGLSLWLGLAAALLVVAPVLEREAIAPAVARRLDRALFGALGLVVIALAGRALVDGVAPATSLVAPVAAMAGARVLAALALSRTRLLAARPLLVTAEVCLALYALYALS